MPCFAANNFRYLFWQFSNFLSEFPHMMCSKYLYALDGLFVEFDSLLKKYFVSIHMKTIPNSDVPTCTHTHIWTIETKPWKQSEILCSVYRCSFIPFRFGVTYFHLHYSIEPWSRKICYFFAAAVARSFFSKNHWSTMVSFIFLSSFSSSSSFWNTSCRIWTYFFLLFFFCVRLQLVVLLYPTP